MMSKQGPNYIYIRKIASSHDLEKEINVGLPIFKNFFGNEKNLIFTRKNAPGRNYNIEMQSVDNDPRMGKDFKQLLADEGGYNIDDLVIIYKKNSTNYQVELIKKTDSQYNAFNQFYTDINSNERHTSIFIEESNIQKNDINNLKPTQTIFYGVPGCGKSHLIKKAISDKLKIKDSETQIIRTVFHPEYTNADFVGQILPDLKDKTIVYKFVPGPFAQILKKALLDDKNNYVLIIEEINRGNSAAIFGELFQLLDRIKPYDSDAIGGNSYTEGWSEYFVMNSSINEYIRGAETEIEKSGKAIDIFVDGNSKIHFSANTGIRLPPNLSILATMNTSDQNVFKLDNAFKRRWDLQLVPNEFGDENGKLSHEEESQRDAEVEDFDFTWNEFRTAINRVISSPDNSFDSSSFSDKQLGCWFVKAENGKIKREVFVHKVLEYLWDDVFTFEKTLVFEKKYQTFAELSNSVLKGKEKDEKKDIFSENFLHILNAQKQKPEDKETNFAAEKSQSENLENQQNQDL